jgi:hypothetical protein
VFLVRFFLCATDDVIEAYVVSSDEAGNFFQIDLLSNFGDTQQLPGFSVPVDASNLYIEFRGNKVYVKLKDLYTDLYFGVCVLAVYL